MSGFDNSSAANIGTSVSPTELENTAVTPGSYTYMSGTVDADGRLTAASNGTVPYVPGGTDVVVSDGGTGASTAAGARTNLGILSSRASAQFDSTNQTLTNVPGLSVTVSAGATYEFRARLNCSLGAGGGVVSVGGTATATAIIWEALAIYTDLAIGAGPDLRKTALGDAVVVGSGAASLTVLVEGTITVNAGGTLTIQFSRETASGTSSVLIGSVLRAEAIA